MSHALAASKRGGCSLDALYLAVAEALETGRVPPDRGPAQPGLFDEPREPAAEDWFGGASACLAEAEGAARAVRCRSDLIFDLCLRAWMSEEGVERELLLTAAEAGREGEEVAADHSRPHVRTLMAACRRVDREICRLQGFARFSPRGDGSFSAPLEPDHNVIAALMPHFSRRFGRQPFAIVDLRRRIAFAWGGGAVSAFEGDGALALLPASGNDEESALWRRYFGAAENADRRNPRLQRSLMPARYWKYLPELSSAPRPALP